MIVVDATVSDPDLVLCQVASDNVEAGRIECEALAKVKPNAKRVIVHYSVNPACIDRVDGFKAEMAEITMKPSTETEFSGDDAIKMQKLLDALENLDDVQEVYSNAVINE